MAVLALERVSLAFGPTTLLDAATLQVEAGERLALVGRNGSGKSTLLALLADALQPDTGTVYRLRSLRLAFVPQEPLFTPTDTVTHTVTQALGALGEAVEAYHQTTVRLASASAAEAERLLAQLQTLQSRLEHGDGWRLHTQVESMLSRFELPPDVPVGQLSSGWQRRVSLARALVGDPEVLLLDEPTNHLDLATIDWLEGYLQNFPGTLLFVTHDRTFLDRLATGIVELDRGQLRRFPGNWATYRVHKQALLEVEDAEAAKFDKFLAQEEDWIRQGVRARRTRNEGRVRRLQAMREDRQNRREMQGQVQLNVASGALSGHLVAEVSGVSKAFGDHVVVRNFSTRIMRGDRIGLVGPNGVGKSTLLKILLKDMPPDTGEVRHGTKLNVAYFDQRRDQLDLEATLWETLCPNGGDMVMVGGEQRHIVSYLAEFLFPPQAIRGRVKSLSGGERNRLLLARLFTQPANLLVLDEPTNDLDVDTLEMLEGMLAEYDGTLLLVSHDRAFLDGVVTSIYAFEGDGRVREYVGGYSDWQRARQAQARPATPAKRPTAPPPAPPRIRRGLTPKERRELEGLPDTIEALEAEQVTLHSQLNDADLFHRAPATFQAVMERLTALPAELEAAYNRWEELERRQQEA